MHVSLRRWLTSDEQPSNFYQLLGRAPFDPDVPGLLAAVRTLLREAMAGQSHEDPVVAKRALKLQRELGRAELTFAQADRLEEYRRGLAAELRTRIEAFDAGWQTWSAARLHDWLGREAGVQAAHCEVAAALMRAPSRPTVESEPADTIEYAAGSASSIHDGPRPLDAEPPQRSRVFGTPSRPRSPTPAATKSPVAAKAPAADRFTDHLPKPAAPPSSPTSRPLTHRATLPPPARTPPTDEIEVVDLVGDQARRRTIVLLGAAGLAVVVLLVVVGLVVSRRGNSAVADPTAAAAAIDVSPTTAPAVVAPVATPVVSTPPAPPPQPIASVVPVKPQPRPLPAVGKRAEFDGHLEMIWGQHQGDKLELHLAVYLDEPYAGGRYVEAVTGDEQVHRDLLDYLTWGELSEKLTNAPREHADHVRLVGTRVDPEQAATFRLSNASSGILLQFESLERIGAAESRVAVGTPRRPETFTAAASKRALLGFLRAPLGGGDAEPIQGIFRGYLADSQSALVSPWHSDFGAEVLCAAADVAAYSPGDEIELTAAPQGRARPRVIKGTTRYRPILQGSAVGGTGGSAPSSPTEPAKQPAASVATARNSQGAGESVLVMQRQGPGAWLMLDGRWQALSLSGKTPRQINWVHLDRNRRAWLGGEGGVSCYDGATVRVYGTSDGLPPQTISNLFEDSQGRMWACSWGGGVAYLAGERWRTLQRGDGLQWLDLNGCVEDARGRVWAAGGGPGVELTAPLVYQFDDAAGKFQVEDDWNGWRLPVMSIAGDRRGTVYLGCIGGIVRVDADKALRTLTPDDGLPQRTPQALLIDSQERLWAGTWGGGVVQIDPQNFSVMREASLAAAGQVTRFAEQADGTIWAATAGQGLWKLSGDAWQKESVPGLADDAAILVATLPVAAARQLAGSVRAPTTASSPPQTPPATPPSSPPASSPPPPRPVPRSAFASDYDSVDLPTLAVQTEPTPLVAQFCRSDEAAALQLELHTAIELVPSGWQYRLEPDAAADLGRRWNVVAEQNKSPKGTIARFELFGGDLYFQWLAADSLNQNLRNAVLFPSQTGNGRPLMLRQAARTGPINVNTLLGRADAVLNGVMGSLRTEGLRWQLTGISGFPAAALWKPAAVAGSERISVGYYPGDIGLEWRLELVRDKDELKCRYVMFAKDGKRTRTVTADIIQNERKGIQQQIVDLNRRAAEINAARAAIELERPTLGNDPVRIADFNQRVESFNQQLQKTLADIRSFEVREKIYDQVTDTVVAMHGNSTMRLRVFFKCNGREFDLARVE